MSPPFSKEGVSLLRQWNMAQQGHPSKDARGSRKNLALGQAALNPENLPSKSTRRLRSSIGNRSSRPAIHKCSRPRDRRRCSRIAICLPCSPDVTIGVGERSAVLHCIRVCHHIPSPDRAEAANRWKARAFETSGGSSFRVGGNLFSTPASPGRRVRESRSNKISSITFSCISLSAPSALRLASSNKSIMIVSQGCGLMHVCLAWRSTLVKLSTTTPSPFTSWIIIPPSSCQRPSFKLIRTVFSLNETWNTSARKDGFQSILPTRVKFTRTLYQLPLLSTVHRHPPFSRLIFASTQASNPLAVGAIAIARHPAQERLVWRLPARRPLRCRRRPARPVSSATAATTAHRRRAEANCLPNSRRGRKPGPLPEAAKQSPRVRDATLRQSLAALTSRYPMA